MHMAHQFWVRFLVAIHRIFMHYIIGYVYPRCYMYSVAFNIQPNISVFYNDLIDASIDCISRVKMMLLLLKGESVLLPFEEWIKLKIWEKCRAKIHFSSGLIEKGRAEWDVVANGDGVTIHSSFYSSLPSPNRQLCSTQKRVDMMGWLGGNRMSWKEGRRGFWSSFQH